MSELQGLIDSKKEYVDHLCDMLAEPMVACLQHVYKEAMERPEARKKSVLVVFQEELGRVASWNQTTITEQFVAARRKSGCKYVADLVKAILVSYVKISIISNTASADTSRIKLRVPLAENFYHKCIVLFAREIWKQPYLFYHKVANIEAQHNLTEVENIARKIVKAAIRSFVPMDQLVRDVNLASAPSESSEEAEEVESSESESDDTEDEESGGEATESEYEEVTEVTEVAEEPEQVVDDSQSAFEESEQVQVIEEPQSAFDEPEQLQVIEGPEQKQVDIVEATPSVCYDDNELKDIEIRSHFSQEDDDVAIDSPKVEDEEEAPKKRIILGSMLINKGRHKLIKPKKKPSTTDAFF